MLRWLGFFLLIGVVAAGVLVYLNGGLPDPSGTPAGVGGGVAVGPGVPEAGAQPAPAAPEPQHHHITRPLAAPLVAFEGRFAAKRVQQVPSMRDGRVLFVGTPAEPGETDALADPEEYFDEEITVLIAERKDTTGIDPRELIKLPTADGEAFYSRLRKTDLVKPKQVQTYRLKVRLRELKEGDLVRRGQLVAMLDPSLAVDDLSIRVAKLDVANAEFEAADKTLAESLERWNTAKNLWAKRAIPAEDYRAAELTYYRYLYEKDSKREGITVAARELRQAETIVDHHFVRSEVTGRVKNVFKHRGESVRNLEPILLLQDSRRLRIEARVDYQYARHLRDGQQVAVEPSQTEGPIKALVGHMAEVTAVAVSKAGEVVSASEDQTVRVWDLPTRQERLILRHPQRVRAVACSATANLCLSGQDDGVAKLWDLSGDGSAPLAELREGGHKGKINCVAFSPDGKWCATGGEDRVICLWDVEGARLLHRLPPETGHRGGVTTVQFVKGAGAGELFLVSAGRGDNTLLVWSLDSSATPGTPRSLGKRDGGVTFLGANSEGHQVLFDQGKELRVLSVPDGALSGVLATGGATNFTTMALFSPNGDLILTAGGSDGRLQLWRAPTEKTRGYELRHLAWSGDQTTCGAFAQDGSFLVTGTRDRAVLVWPVPSEVEVKTQFLATITNVEPDLDLNSRQVRIHAEVDNRTFELTPQALARLQAEAVDKDTLERLKPLLGQEFGSEQAFRQKLRDASFQEKELAANALERRLIDAAEKPGALLPGNTATLVVYPKAPK
jgi:WD40 repeat protein